MRCEVCKKKHDGCPPNCIWRDFLPAGSGEDYEVIRTSFDLTNVKRMLMNLPANLRRGYFETVLYEARNRNSDRVTGNLRKIDTVFRRIAHQQNEFDNGRVLVNYFQVQQAGVHVGGAGPSAPPPPLAEDFDPFPVDENLFGNNPNVDVVAAALQREIGGAAPPPPVAEDFDPFLVDENLFANNPNVDVVAAALQEEIGGAAPPPPVAEDFDPFPVDENLFANNPNVDVVAAALQGEIGGAAPPPPVAEDFDLFPVDENLFANNPNVDVVADALQGEIGGEMPGNVQGEMPEGDENVQGGDDAGNIDVADYGF